MNKKSKTFLFLGLTLIILILSTGVISATNQDNTQSMQINTPESITDDNIQSETSPTREVKTPEPINKNVTKKITTQTKKQTKKAVETTQTANNYETLKNAWNNIQTSGDNTTQYIINLKNGKYQFEDELKTETSNETRHITINGEDVNKTILDGGNKTRFFNLNNTNQIININNITFSNGYNNSKAGAIYVNSPLKLNNTQFINNTLTGQRVYGGALYTDENILIYNSAFINNSAISKNGTSIGGAIYATKNLTIYNCEFINNKVVDDEPAPTTYSAQGGALYLNGASSETFNIEYCEFNNNSGNSSIISSNKAVGGAICDSSYDCLNIRNCNFINNHATRAGAIRIDCSGYYGKPSPNIIACVFENNTSNKTKDYNTWISLQRSTKLNFGGTYYADKSENSTILVSPNGKSTNTVFNQKTKNLTIYCLVDTDSYYGEITSLGCGYQLSLKSSSNLINTTGLTFTPENKYTVTVDTSKLPANHENIILYVEDIEAAKIVWDHSNVEFKNITTKPGETITLNATFKTSDNKLIPNGRVAFKINGRTIGHSNIEYGTATLNYTIPENYSAKDYILTTTYGGSSDFIEARTNATLHLEKLATKTNLTTSIEGNTLKITVDPKDENGKTVKDGKICVKIEGKTLQTLKITRKTTVNFTIPKSWNNREIKVLAIYGENNNHKQSRMEIKTKLVLPNTKTTKKDDAINNYYVSDLTGSDSNTGTQNSPFKTIQKAIETVNTNKQTANIYLDGNFKGIGNTNLTIPGNLKINFIGVGNSSIDGEVKYDLKYELEDGEYYWGSGVIWRPYDNGTGNWAMKITKGEGLITVNNLTIKNCWNAGGSSINAYKTATIDNYGNLQVNNVSFIYNHGGVGAGIRNNNGSTLKVTNSLFEANRKSSSSGNYGAGIYNNGIATIINSTFQKNYARWGTITNDKNLTIINSTIRDNIGYDGGSRYKSGSGIAINTQNSNYFETVSLLGITTIVDGCYFTNNDQCDIFADLGEINITNNVFNQSTGLIGDGNQSITFNIINNTFDSPVPSRLYTSLTSTNPYLITMKLNGKYNYNIDSNQVLNVNGTLSKALELTSSNSNITNNNFTRIISVNGNDNIITGNNITTTDEYAIELGENKRNNITNNYLIAKVLRGNSAINYTSTTNKVENNTPKVRELQVNNETFYKFFDDDGNLLDTYNEVEQIQIIGSLNNKNLNFNKKISIGQNGKFTSYNTTITTTAEIEVLSFNIINTNQEPVIILNANNCIIKYSTLETNNNNTIILNGSNNTVVNNTLIADLLVGDESVKTDDTNTLNNTPTYKNYVLSDSNFNEYFNLNGSIKEFEVNEIHFLINGTITNKNIILNNNKTIYITNYKDAKFINTTIQAIDETALIMRYITIENTNDKTAIKLEKAEHEITNCNITTKSNTIESTESKNIIINYNNIKTIGTNNIITINLISLKNTAQINENNITTQNTNKNSQSIIIKATNNQTSNIEIGENIITTNTNNATVIDIENLNTSILFNTLNIAGNNSVGFKLSNVTAYLRGRSLIERNTIIINAENSIGVLYENNIQFNNLRSTNIYINSNNSIGIVLNNTTSVKPYQNNIKIKGNGSMAILFNNSAASNITSNNIELLLNENENTAPIIINNSTKIIVGKNNITTTSKYTIIVNQTSTNNKIINNSLYSQYLGDDSVLNLNIRNNKVLSNTPDQLTYFHLNEATYSQYFDENGNLRTNIPEGLIVLLTGNLYNKVLNINKPINLNGNGITLINTTLTITPTGQNSNITGIKFEENSQLIINSSNCNLDVQKVNVQRNDNNSIVVLVNGNNNSLKLGILNSTCMIDDKIDITLLKITGNNNNITLTSGTTTNRYGNKYNHITGILLENANNTSIQHSSYIQLFGLNTTGVIFNNSNNNRIQINQMDRCGTEDNNGIILVNSSYNMITGQYSPSIKLENNTNYNTIERVRTSQIHIINSHYNKIYNNTIDSDLIGHAINITESVGNNVTYNRIQTATLQGNDCIIQENKNNTINNRVEYNRPANTWGKSSRVNITLPDIIKYYDTIQINATAEYQNGSSWMDPYFLVTKGHVTFKVNGMEIGVVNVVDGVALMNYTITPIDGDKLDIELIYEDSSLEMEISSNKSSELIQKIDTRLLMANTSNDGMKTTATTIIVDELGNIIYDGNVTFTLGNETQTVKISNGIAQATFDTSNLNVGKYNITATFNGNSICKGVENTATATITPFDVNIIVNPVTVLAGNKVLLTAKVFDKNGNAVNSGRVVFKLNGKTLKDNEGNVLYANVVNGTASMEYIIPANFSAKNYKLTAVTSDKTYNRAETTTTLTVNKTTPKAVLPTVAKRSKNTQITVKFTDDKNNNIIGENKVCIKLNGKTIQNMKAVNGTVTFNIDLTQYKNNQYNLTVVCGENSRYNTCRTTSVLTLQ